jgi:hypothetical protein
MTYLGGHWVEAVIKHQPTRKLVVRRGEWSATRCRRFSPREWFIVRNVGRASGPVWTSTEKTHPPPGFDSRTFQIIASRYAGGLTFNNLRSFLSSLNYVGYGQNRNVNYLSACRGFNDRLQADRCRAISVAADSCDILSKHVEVPETEIYVANIKKLIFYFTGGKKALPFHYKEHALNLIREKVCSTF